MHPLIVEHLDDLPHICGRRHVSSLALFGSALDERFDPATSDIGLLVEFEPMPPVEHADAYFGLMQDLSDLFGAPVELVELGPIRNPYFRQAVESTKQLLYAAA